jgi:hypothetical protein
MAGAGLLAFNAFMTPMRAIIVGPADVKAIAQTNRISG